MACFLSSFSGPNNNNSNANSCSTCKPAAQPVSSPAPQTNTTSSVPTNQLPPEKIKLTKFASGLGCACKMNQTALMKVLNLVSKEASATKKKDPMLLLGNETGDDASVYKLTDDLAIMFASVSFFFDEFF